MLLILFFPTGISDVFVYIAEKLLILGFPTGISDVFVHIAAMLLIFVLLFSYTGISDVFVHIAEMLVKRIEASRLSQDYTDHSDNPDKTVTLSEAQTTQRSGGCCS